MVMSRESVRIALTFAALNDIKNAYLTAPDREKIWCCPELNLALMLVRKQSLCALFMDSNRREHRFAITWPTA
jgi:hypothetical protein